MHHKAEEFLGVDVGDKRVGLARGSSLAKIAEPVKTLSAEDAIQQIAKTAVNLAADGIVVGLPRGLEGQETGQTKKVRTWAKEAKKVIRLPFYWQDEALTSVTAQSKDSLTAEVDAIAASVILQDFLNTPKEDRVKA